DICVRYPKVDRDLLISGALLHDIGKVAELRYARSFDYSDEGKLLGHIVIGVEMVDEKVRLLPDFPRVKAILIKHLLLSHHGQYDYGSPKHHGQYDYGSPKRPKTLEAVVLNFLDDMDSKINGVQAHIEKEQQSETGWTGYHRMYDRYFFIGDQNSTADTNAVEQAQVLEPVVAPMEKSVVATTAKPEKKSQPRKNERQDSRQSTKHNSPLSSTLESQLSGLNLDLFGSKEEQ
ncbi:MAG: HD domain-containing protein, partial [Deltaproteobacteria bacterium]|nr:HD domain-containing protein [Deltaproteobacteria bacterium]